MRKRLVAANWKLNGSIGLCVKYAAELGSSELLDVWVFPTALHVAALGKELQPTSMRVGVQDVYSEGYGSFTGETSAYIAAETGATCAIVGHSERRTLFEETDQVVTAKFVAAQLAGLTPILCVGESRVERENGNAEAVVQRQIEALTGHAGVAALLDAVIAYEPVWAIGTGLTATPEQAEEMHAYIRTLIASMDREVAAQLRVIYGGSVKASNAAGLIAQRNVDGYLVGGASLDVDEFWQICAAASN